MSVSWNAIGSLIVGLLWLAFLGTIVLAIFVWRSYDSLRTLQRTMQNNLSAAEEGLNRRIVEMNQLSGLLRENGRWAEPDLEAVRPGSPAAEIIAMYRKAMARMAAMRGALQRSPDLKSNPRVAGLVEGLKRSEAEVRKKVNAYDSSIRVYNAVRGGLPTVFYANMIGYPKADRVDPDGHDAALLAEQFKETTVVTTAVRYFYVPSPGAVPKGPASADDLKLLLEQGVIQNSTLVAEVGSDEWVSIEAVAARL